MVISVIILIFATMKSKYYLIEERLRKSKLKEDREVYDYIQYLKKKITVKYLTKDVSHLCSTGEVMDGDY